uniref:Sulfotransferase n=1 Tax=Colobus angolensis palliatus TaxID=336983 RepID=A0A2K5KAZ9_COLAP
MEPTMAVGDASLLLTTFPREGSSFLEMLLGSQIVGIQPEGIKGSSGSLRSCLQPPGGRPFQHTRAYGGKIKAGPRGNSLLLSFPWADIIYFLAPSSVHPVFPKASLDSGLSSWTHLSGLLC